MSINRQQNSVECVTFIVIRVTFLKLEIFDFCACRPVKRARAAHETKIHLKIKNIFNGERFYLIRSHKLNFV